MPEVLVVITRCHKDADLNATWNSSRLWHFFQLAFLIRPTWSGGRVCWAVVQCLNRTVGYVVVWELHNLNADNKRCMTCSLSWVKGPNTVQCVTKVINRPIYILICMYEETESWLNSGNACCYSVQNLMTSTGLSKDTQTETHKYNR
jgi:hypothetical protein